MRIVWPFRSLSVARGCAQVDSRLDTAKICSNRRVDADRPRLRAVFGGGKTFLHSLGHSLQKRDVRVTSAFHPIAAKSRTCRHVAKVPLHKVAALQPAAREQEPRGRWPAERIVIAVESPRPENRGVINLTQEGAPHERD